jgi:hypothetical protein
MRSKTHFIFAAIVAVFIIGSGSGNAFASAPANDNFSSAQNLIVNQNTLTANNAEATKEPGEPAHGWNRGGKSVWYKYVAAANGVLTVESSGIDSLMGVYQGGSLGSLVLVAANDDLVTGNGIAAASEVVFGVQAGVTYYIAVDGKYQPNGNGNVSSGPLTLDYDFTVTPANDAWSLNRPLSAASNFYHYTATNQNAVKEAGEPNHAGNTGGRSVWFRIDGQVTPHSYNLTVEGSQPANAAAGIATLISIYKGNSLANLTPVTSTVTPAHHRAQLTFLIPSSTTYYIAIDGYNGGSGAAIGNFQISLAAAKTRRHPEFDGDGKTEISVFRPSTGVWYTMDSVSGGYHPFVWGQNGDVPLFNHWDDDGRQDYSVYRPSTNVWHVLRSFDNTYGASFWGAINDVPFTVNEFKSGATNCYQATFRPSNGTWYIRNPGGITFQFGQNGDIPLVADFDGDGTDEVAVFRPSNGVWYIGHPFDNAPYTFSQFGLAGDRPVPADYDGDGLTDLAVFRPSTGTWYILRTLDGNLRVVPFGEATDIPQPADFDNGGRDEVAVFRPSTGVWYIQPEFTTYRTVQFGQTGDIPVSAPIFGGN